MVPLPAAEGTIYIKTLTSELISPPQRVLPTRLTHKPQAEQKTAEMVPMQSFQLLKKDVVSI